MATTVGMMQSKFSDALQDLVELEYDVIDAYESAAQRVRKPEFKEKMVHFCSDHQRQVHDLSQMIRDHGMMPPTGPSTARNLLSQGKVMITSMVSDNALLGAMRSNEVDASTAHDRILIDADAWPEARVILARGQNQDKEHMAWFDVVLG